MEVNNAPAATAGNEATPVATTDPTPAGDSIADALNAHLNRDGNEPTPEQPQEPAQPAGNPPPSEGGSLSAEEQLKAYQLMIAANPVMSAEYERLLNGGQPAQPAQPQPQPGQPQPQAATASNVNDEPLPEWNAFDEDTVRQHGRVWLREEIAPVQETLNQVVQVLQGIMGERVQTQQQQLVDSLDEVMFSELPSARDNDQHFEVANMVLRDELSKIPQNMLANPQVLAEASRRASTRTKQILGIAGVQPAPVPGQQPQAIQPAAQKPYAEAPTNYVTPRANEPNDVNGLLMAHLHRGK